MIFSVFAKYMPKVDPLLFCAYLLDSDDGGVHVLLFHVSSNSARERHEQVGRGQR